MRSDVTSVLYLNGDGRVPLSAKTNSKQPDPGVV
jgi:hypothetical protein